MCMSALPATLVDVATPSVPRVSTEAERFHDVAESGPAEHYRPPIASFDRSERGASPSMIRLVSLSDAQVQRARRSYPPLGAFDVLADNI